MCSFSEQYDLTVIVDSNFMSVLCTSEESVVVNSGSNSFASVVVTILNEINNVQSVEMLLSSGDHFLNQTVRLTTNNVFLRSATDDQPTIICSDELQFMQQSVINTHEAVTVLEFVNAKLVEIYGIDYEGCSGSISFKNVSNLIVMNSLFRLISNY